MATLTPLNRLSGSSMATLLQTLATGPSETWLFKMEQLLQEGLLRLLGSLSFQVRETEKKKKIVLHALSNNDNAGSIETMLSDMKELPDSVDGLLGLFELLSVQVKEMKKEKKGTRALLRSPTKKKDVVQDALFDKVNATGVVSEKKPDDHWTYFPARLCMEKLPDSIEGLLVLLGSLSVQAIKLKKKKEAVLHASKKYKTTTIVSEKNSNARPTIEDIINVFVEEIEKANQYFDFQEYLKQHDLVKPGKDGFGALEDLVYSQKVHHDSKFDKLDFDQILDAIEGRTSSKAFSDTENDWYTLMWPQKNDVALVNPILSLVFYIRKKGHVMDENPLVELSYIINYTFVFYKVCVIRRLLKFSEKAVWVFSPTNFDEGKMKYELSFCGDIESYRLESSSSENGGGYAHVTFKNSEAAKIAPLFARTKSRLFVELAEEKYEYQPEETITKYNEARSKYEEFRNYHQNYPKKMSN